MSVQLVLYPQNYNGYRYTSGQTQSEFIADNNLFVSVGTGTSDVVLTAGQTPVNAISSSAPITNWKKYNFTGEAAPTLSSGRLHITGQNGNTQYAGVYQKITNLIVGQSYIFKMSVQTGLSANSSVQIGFLGMPNMLGGSMQFCDCTAIGPTPSLTFTAQNTEEILCVNMSSSSAEVLKINYMTLEAALMSRDYLDPQDGQVIVDLYEEEEIPLTLSVDDFKNVAEKVQSYSKDFNLPATKRNNKIFDNIFEITRSDNGLVFNPYTQTGAILKENGFTVFQGFLRLIEIKTQEGEISYNVNLYSEAIALADVLESKKFSDLDFSELDHDYNRTNIQRSWYNTQGVTLINTLSTSSFAYDAALGTSNTLVLKYPFVDWTGTINRFALTTQTSADSGQPSVNNLADIFRPFIQVKYLINKIFSDAGFTWTSAFFDTANFGRLFMDFNWGNDVSANDYSDSGDGLNSGNPSQFAGTSYATITSWDGGANLDNMDFNYSTGVFTVSQNNTFFSFIYYVPIFFSSGVTGTQSVTIEWVKNGTVISGTQQTFSASASTTRIYQGNFIILANATDTIQLQWEATQASAIRLKKNTDSGFLAPTNIAVTIGIDSITSGTLLNTLRGELGQWDFFKGIMTMFNLITLQDTTNPTNLIIEPYDDIFINNTNAVTYDWTHKIDESQIQLKPLDLKRDVIFQYEEDDDYRFSVYKNATNQHLYGSYKYPTSQYTLLTGEEKIEATPFAASIMSPVFDDTFDFVAPSIYDSNEDGTDFESFDNKPRILYDISNGTPHVLGNNTYFIPAQNGVSGAQQDRYALFSHTTQIPATASDTDYNFGACQFINGIGVAPIDNLFNTYYSNYYDELYHPDTRTLNVKVLLNPSDIANFEFYDKVRIKNREYRVNKINYKPKDLSTVEFILIS
jgi:hypothetical protein